jgi:hypothetical protein
MDGQGTNPLRPIRKSSRNVPKGIVDKDEKKIQDIIQYTREIEQQYQLPQIKYRKTADGVYFTYGVEWDAARSNFMDNRLKDRSVVLTNKEGKYQITSEKTTLKFIPPCEDGKECDKCKYTVEAQLGVYQENNNFDMKEMSESFDRFETFLAHANAGQMIGGRSFNTTRLHQSRHRDSPIHLQQDVMTQHNIFSDCGMTQYGLFQGEKSDKKLPDEVDYVNDYYYTRGIIMRGKPQITVGVELQHVYEIYRKYYKTLYTGDNDFNKIEGMIMAIMFRRGGINVDNAISYITRNNSYNIPFDIIRTTISSQFDNSARSFLFLLYYYAYTYLYNRGVASYIKAKHHIKLRTNPAALYRDLSPSLKASILFFCYLLENLVNWSTFLTEEYVKYFSDYNPNSGISVPYPLTITCHRIVLKKIKQIAMPQYSYVIREFDSSPNLPDGVQNRTIFDLSNFDNFEYRRAYSGYFNISPENVRRIPFVNYKYNEDRTKFKKDVVEPFLHIEEVKGLHPELKLHGERMDIWEWDSESYDDVYVVHLEFRSVPLFYNVATKISAASYNITLKQIENIDNISDMKDLKYIVKAIVNFFFKPIIQIGYNPYPFDYNFINTEEYRDKFKTILVQNYPQYATYSDIAVDTFYEVINKNCQDGNVDTCQNIITSFVLSEQYEIHHGMIANNIVQIGLAKYLMSLLLGNKVDEADFNFYEYSDNFLKAFEKYQTDNKYSFEEMVDVIRQLGLNISQMPDEEKQQEQEKDDYYDYIMQSMKDNTFIDAIKHLLGKYLLTLLLGNKVDEADFDFRDYSDNFFSAFYEYKTDNQYSFEEMVDVMGYLGLNISQTPDDEEEGKELYYDYIIQSIKDNTFIIALNHLLGKYLMTLLLGKDKVDDTIAKFDEYSGNFCNAFNKYKTDKEYSFKEMVDVIRQLGLNISQMPDEEEKKPYYDYIIQLIMDNTFIDALNHLLSKKETESTES